MRYDQRGILWRVTKRKRLAICGRIAGLTGAEAHRLETDLGPLGTMRGLAVCGSVWACPVCSAHIRQARAVELQEACERVQSTGGGLAMVTLTVRHHAGQSLAETLSGLMAAWASVKKGSPWKRAKDRYGIVGYVRAVEITWGHENGWHPHIHVLVVLERPLDVLAHVQLQAWLARRWAAAVTRAGLGTPDSEHGVRVQEAGVGGGLYVAKVQERSVALEMTRGDLKRGRGQRFLPFDLLASAGTGEVLALRLWWEYEAVTAGRRCLEWSRGLRDRLGLGQEATDEEIAEEDHTTAESLLLVIASREWRSITRARLDHAVLEACEHPDGREAAIRAVERVVAAAVAHDDRGACSMCHICTRAPGGVHESA